MTANVIKNDLDVWKRVHSCVFESSSTKASFLINWILDVVYLSTEYSTCFTKFNFEYGLFILIAAQWSLFIQSIGFAFYSQSSASFINTMKCSKDIYTKKIPLLIQSADLSMILLSVLFGTAISVFFKKRIPISYITKGFILCCLLYNLLISIWFPFTISRGKKGFLKRGFCTFSSIKDSLFSTGIAEVLAAPILPLGDFMIEKGEGLMEGHMGLYNFICIALILLAYVASRIELTVYYTRHR